MNGQAMAAIEAFAANWAVWMLEMSLQVAVLAAAVAVLAWACGRRSASFRYALWLVVLVRLAIPPSLSLPTGWGWWLRGETAGEAIGEKETPTTNVALVETSSSVPIPQSDAPRDSSPGVVSTAAAPSPAPVSLAPLPESPSPEPAPQSPAQAAVAAARLPSWAALLLLGWAGVSLTLLGLLFVGAVRTRQWVRQASRDLGPRTLRILGRARWRLEVTQDIELRNSENCTTPLVVGWWRPVILLPASVPQELDDDELEAVLLHELNHVLRRDALVNFAQAVLGAVYFFHPLVWWANAEIRRLREDACDEMTVAALEGRRKAYGSALVKVSEILGYAAPPLALGVMESPHPAKRRLGRILDPNLPLADRWSRLSLALVAILAIVFLPGGPRPVLSLADELASTTASEPDGPATRTVQPDNASRPIEVTRPTDAPPPQAQAGEPPLLRYGWKPGQSLAYSIHIEGQDAEGIETRDGNLTYTVGAADTDRATLTAFGSTHGFRHPHPEAYGIGAPGIDHMRRLGPPGRIGPIAMGPIGPRWRGPDYYYPFEDGGPGAFPQDRSLTVDRSGRVESIRGSVLLPFALGDLARLAILPLPAAGQREWSVSGPIKIELENRDEGLPRSAFFRPAPEVLEAEETCCYRLISWTAEEAIVERQQETATLQRIDGQPRLAIRGTGQATFDLQSGVVKSLQWNLTLTANKERTMDETTVVVTCQRVDSEPTVAGAAPSATSSAPPKPIDLAQVVRDLDSGDLEVRLAALCALHDVEINSDRATIAGRLKAFLADADTRLREAAGQAFSHWAGEEDIDVLLGLLDNDSAPVRCAAMDALGRLQAAAAMDRLAEHLPVVADRAAASRALLQLGPAAESPVLPLLDHGDWAVRLTAIHILRDVGSERSLEKLKSLAQSDSQDNVRTWATLAVESIEKRLAGEG